MRRGGGAAGAAGSRLGGLLGAGLAVALALYFAFAAVQGDDGLLRRVAVEARTEELREELAAVEAAVESRHNLVRRLSDDYLDIDLLDERARAVLGYVRAGEVVLR